MATAFSVSSPGKGGAGPPGWHLGADTREGLLLLCPSHDHHRTIPFVSDPRRISFAFDVCPI